MTSSGITDLLQRWRSGEHSVESELLALVYPVLRDIARTQVRRSGGALTLQATELANEAYAKLRQQHHVDWESRTHFFAIAALVIRRIVVDYLRERGSEKRGGKMPFVSLHDVPEEHVPPIDDSVDWIAVDQAIFDLERFDRDCARVVELKFFSGLSTERIAEVCGSSVATVGRQWRFARAWLGRRLGSIGGEAPA